MDRAKRRTIALALALAAQLALPCAQAEDYPARPVRIIVGFIPGSSADITARVLGQRMGQILGQQSVVENKPGAGSSLAAEFVARAPPMQRCRRTRSPRRWRRKASISSAEARRILPAISTAR